MSTCPNGWHRVGHGDSLTYFAFGARLGDAQGTYIYLVNSEPRGRRSRSIWCYGDHGVPWTCVVCGLAIDHGSTPLSDAARKRRRERDASYDPRRGRLARTTWRIHPARRARLAPLQP